MEAALVRLKFLMVGDVHLSDKPPTTRVEGYARQMIKKLWEIGSLAQTFEGVTATVFVGDIFHSKKPQKTSHTLVRAAAVMFKRMGHVIVVPGNHDYDKANPDNLAKAPLGVLAELPNVELLGIEGARYHSWGDFKMAGVREEEDLLDWPSADMIVAHSAIFPPGQTPEVWEALDARQVASFYSLGSKPQLIYYGHIHEPHGAYDVDGIEFVNFGAISRGSMHEPDFDRIPQIGVVEFEDGELMAINAVNLKTALPAEEVFRIEEVTQERSDAAEKAEFIEKLSQAEMEVFSVERAISAISERSDVDKAVRDRAIELIEEVI